MAAHVAAMVAFQDAGAAVFDYGNSIRAEAQLGGSTGRSSSPGSCRRTSARSSRKDADRSAGLPSSGDPEDIYKTDRAIAELFPEDAALHRWLEKAGEKVHFEGLPARICWLGYKERHLAGLSSTRWSPRASCRPRS